MNGRRVVAPIVVMMACGLVVTTLVHGELATAFFGSGVHGQLIESLESSLEDQKALAAAAAPEEAAVYRQRFDNLQSLLVNLRVVEQNRGRLIRNTQIVLLAVLVLVVAAGAVAASIIARRDQRRMEILRDALQRLSSGEPVKDLNISGRDVIARVGAMVEDTSRLMGSQRRRLESLRKFASWQEAARRQVHEFRGPLAAAQLQIARLGEELGSSAPGVAETISVLRTELATLAGWTRSAARFGRLGSPSPEPLDLVDVVRRFVSTFATAWPELELTLDAEGAAMVVADPEMLRQLLVNLAQNSAHALDGRNGTLEFRLRRSGDEIVLDAQDDGPGVDPGIRGRIFEPHATTRPLGQGSGLGLAICRKIALDHGGDLTLEDEPRGATFRLRLPAQGSPGAIA
jgi:two-component system nitrogen regulation sensor histidine kinase NtrY